MCCDRHAHYDSPLETRFYALHVLPAAIIITQSFPGTNVVIVGAKQILPFALETEHGGGQHRLFALIGGKLNKP